MSDRDTQDEVIRALADAGYRRSEGWVARGLVPPDRAERFARFLARQFYRQRIVHFFRYSRRLARALGRSPEEVIDKEAFAALLPDAVLGSRETASPVAALVVAHMGEAPGREAVPYLEDLLRYEEAMLVAEAGPRRPGADGPATAPQGGAFTITEGTRLLELEHDLPAVLPELLRPGPAVPVARPRRTRLVVARTPRGRVMVAAVGEDVVRLLPLADGRRTVRDLAIDAGVDPERADRAFRELEELGAVRASSGS